MAFYCVGTKNTSQSIYLPKNEHFLMLTKMRNGTSHCLLNSCICVHLIVVTRLAYVCRLKDKYHPINLVAVIERLVVLAYFMVFQSMNLLVS